ncbi:hypothetical protein PBY51_009002 [Eleginops maclovinus]|uniref:Uncharacterized protein n=1 Tax=Eleginops maclovinus TaxID=56733 RepID=A0AAN7WV72_ELEMC|nr:hypothetical protein PBY51_009002 [Eleginops maclovinus]
MGALSVMCRNPPGCSLVATERLEMDEERRRQNKPLCADDMSASRRAADLKRQRGAAGAGIWTSLPSLNPASVM